MMNIRTTFTAQFSHLTVTHEACSYFGKPGDNVLLLTAVDCDPDTLSRISITALTQRTIYVHWASHMCTKELNLLFLDEPPILFVGAGTISASINVETMEVIEENCVTLFWGFERKGNFILELGELECFLYNLSGVCVDKVPVDPLYEFHETERGIRFESPVNGTQHLFYPE